MQILCGRVTKSFVLHNEKIGHVASPITPLHSFSMGVSNIEVLVFECTFLTGFCLLFMSSKVSFRGVLIYFVLFAQFYMSR